MRFYTTGDKPKLSLWTIHSDELLVTRSVIPNAHFRNQGSFSRR